MQKKKVKKLDALKALIDGVNIYTGVVVDGIDDCLREDLVYIYDYLSKRTKTNNPDEKKEENVKPQQKSVDKSVDNTLILRKGRIEIDGQKYTLNEGSLFDSMGMKIPEGKAITALFKYYSQIDYSQLDESQLLEYIKALKNSKLFQLCTDVIEEELTNEHEYSFMRAILPIYTSALRERRKPELAIKFWEENSSQYYVYESVALFTSLAAAYCDIKDYATSRKLANRAYAMSGGGAGYQTELSLVYNRLKKEAGE